VLPAREVQFGVFGELDIESEIGCRGRGAKGDVALDQREFRTRLDVHFDRRLADASRHKQDLDLHALLLHHTQTQSFTTTATIEVQIVPINRGVFGLCLMRIDAEQRRARQRI
jgi:hypothetical protein